MATRSKLVLWLLNGLMNVCMQLVMALFVSPGAIPEAVFTLGYRGVYTGIARRSAQSWY